MTAPADVLIGVVPVVLAAAFLLLIVQSMGDRATGLVDKMKQAVGGAVMLLVALLVVFAFLGGGGGDDPGPDPPEPAEEYDVLFHVASDSQGYGTVSISSLADVPEGASVTVAQTLTVGSAGQCVATPAADTAQYTYAFSGWTGADDSSTPAPTSITADTHYYAHFTRTVKTYTVSFHVASDSAGYGTISVQSVQGVPYGTSVTVAQTIAVGAVGQCTATPSADTIQYSYAFAGWTGADDPSTAAPTVISGDTAYYAHFTRTAIPQPMDPSLFTFTVADGEATVTGWAGTPPADGYDLYLPDTDGQGHPLTAIGGGSSSSYVSVFAGAKTLRADAVESVGGRAFKQATLLASVSLPAAESIEHNAFHTCTSLASVSLPAAESIGAAAFINCTSLASVSLPAARSIGTSAFAYCTGISSVALGPLTGTLDSNAFPDWTFYDTDGTTVLSKTAASLANSTFEGTASALIKVDPNRGLTLELEQRVQELTAEHALKKSMLEEIDPDLAELDSDEIALMTVEQIRGLTPEDVRGLKAEVERKRSGGGE